MRPNSINVLGKIYSVIYCKTTQEVDVFKRSVLLGQVDFETVTIRVFDSGNESSMFQTLLHEVFHAITTDLHINTILKAADVEDVIDLLALGMNDIMTQNKWLIEDKSSDSTEKL
jgi:hypothetical protein